MSKLLLTIQDAVQEVSEAMCAAIGMDSEIVDDELRIVAGTGRYFRKIGQIEEEGDFNCGEIYSLVLTTGKEYIIEDAPHDPIYLPREKELAEVCCPIKLDGEIIGLIGLVAFNEDQKKVLLEKAESFLVFTRRMASLIASKASEVKISNEMKIMLESIHDGIILVNENGIITSCNKTAAKLMSKSEDKLIGNKLQDFWNDSPIMNVIQTGIGYKDREEIYNASSENYKHFVTTVSPVFAVIEKSQGMGTSKCTGAVISFRDIAGVRKLLYNMTEKKQDTSIDEILGNSIQINELKKKVLKIAKGRSTVLITGESGTGKEVFAKAIHFSSPRKDEPFITVNCGAIPENLMESELFGYDSGAFTGANRNGKPGKFELANGGTIFLDEIGDLPLHLQVKLLSVLQSQKVERVGGTKEIPVDVRVIAATNQNLEKMVTEKRFREDLYFRLHVIPFYIPPLRERKEDILILSENALNRYNALLGKRICGFSQDAISLLLNYSWDGNVRELENVIEYAVNMEDGDFITIEGFPPLLRSQSVIKAEIDSLGKQYKELDKKVIAECLRKGGKSLEEKREIAKLLGISQSTLYRKIRELKLENKEL